MKTDNSPAIILRVKEFGESDLLVTFFARDKGQLKGVAKGARRSLKRFVNCFDICSLVNLEFTFKRGGDLCFLDSGKLVNAFPGVRSDFAALSLASFMIELTEILFPFGVSEAKMFELLREAFDAMSEGEALKLVPVIFEVKAMALGGYRINLGKCSLCGRPYTGEGMAVFNREKGSISCLKCQQASALSPTMRPETVKALHQMQTEPLSASKQFKLADEILKEIKKVLKLHREYRLERRVKTSKYVE